MIKMKNLLKKNLALLLAVVLCLCLAACGGNAPETLENIVLDDSIDDNLEDTYDKYLGSLIFVRTVHPLQMIVEGCTGQLSDLRQDCRRIFLPQFLDHLRFFCRRRSFSKTKACSALSLQPVS